MASSTVSWNDAVQGSTISGLENQVSLMKEAKNKIVPEIEVLRPNWDTEGSQKTITALETFLNNDFEEFMKAFNVTIMKLQRVRELSAKMNEVQ